MDDERVTAIATALAHSGTLELLGDHDAALWRACDLASCVENRFHQQLDPRKDDLEPWAKRALAPDEELRDPRRRDWDVSFWIRRGSERAGTLSIAKTTLGTALLRASSLYVFPEHRGRGVAERALRQVYVAATAAGLAGIRVSTHWTWQRALRLYARLGMWCFSFKRGLELAWADDLPAHVVEIDGDRARFSVAGRTLITAAREGDRLLWTVAVREEEEASLPSAPTFALALALQGWPLLETPGAIGDAPGWDVGGPDVLAWKIGVFEALERKCGFDVRTPRIPGLPYEEIAREVAR